MYGSLPIKIKLIGQYSSNVASKEGLYNDINMCPILSIFLIAKRLCRITSKHHAGGHTYGNMPELWTFYFQKVPENRKL